MCEDGGKKGSERESKRTGRTHQRSEVGLAYRFRCGALRWRKDVRLAPHSRQASDEEISNEEMNQSVGLVCLGLT